MNIRELSLLLKPEQAALVLDEQSRFYLTGFAASDGALLVTRDASFFWTDSRYIEAAEAAVTDASVILQEPNLYAQVEPELKRAGITELLVEASRLSIQDLNNWRVNLRDYTYNVSNHLDLMISSLREVKLPEEVEKLARAQSIAEAGFRATLPYIKPGTRERDIANELEYNMKKNGADGISFETIVVSGANSSKPHGVPGDKCVEDGDFVTIDFGALYEGYHSDTTRTVAVGHVTDEMANVYDLVLKAQTAACDALKPGLAAAEYDKVARDIITEAGYGPYFGHSLGHGVGVEIHEHPFCGPRSGSILQAGNVVTSEPGIYLPGKFGVRIEDMLLVTQEGSRNFCRLPKELLVLK